MTTPNTANLIEALNLKDLPPKEQEEMLLTLNDLIFKSSLVRLIERMDDVTRDEFSALIDKDASEEQMLEFLKKKVPTADEAVAEAIDEITDDILGATP